MKRLCDFFQNESDCDLGEGSRKLTAEGKMYEENDYKEYKEKCRAIRKENEHFLELFEESLQNLKPVTIERHLSNVDFYINEYLLYEDARSFEKGILEIDSFLGDFFIRKCMWSTPGTIKSTAASIKKFYKCMLDNNLIQKSDFEYLSDTIKEEIQEWQDSCAAYNDPDEVNPFMMW